MTSEGNLIRKYLSARNGRAGRTWTAMGIVPVLFFAVAAWGGGDSGADPLWVRLVRTECYGECPSYDVTIYADGRVEYTGYRYVARPGRHEKRIAPERFQLLRKKIQQLGFWRMENHYTSDITDSPHQIITVKTQTNEKSVDDYITGPKALKDLENFIDEVAGTSEWVGRCRVERNPG